jgi:hypothetical protein
MLSGAGGTTEPTRAGPGRSATLLKGFDPLDKHGQHRGLSSEHSIPDDDKGTQKLVNTRQHVLKYRDLSHHHS